MFENLKKKALLYFYSVWMTVLLDFMYMDNVCAMHMEARDGIVSPGTRVMHGCEPCMDSGNCTQDLYESDKHS